MYMKRFKSWRKGGESDLSQQTPMEQLVSDIYNHSEYTQENGTYKDLASWLAMKQ